MSGSVTRIAKLQGCKEKSLERSWASRDGRLTAFTASNGYVLVTDNRTRQLCMEVKMNGTARTVAWPSLESDDRYLLTSGGDADVSTLSINALSHTHSIVQVYVWDMRASSKSGRLVGSAGACVRRWKNEGGLPTSAMAVHRNSLAVASEAGVVNLYDLSPSGLPGTLLIITASSILAVARVHQSITCFV